MDDTIYMRFLCSAFCAIAALSSLHAQSVASSPLELQSLAGKQFVVRGFSAEDNVQFDWNGNSFSTKEARLRTFGVLKITSVTLKKNQVQIDGTRGVLLKAENGQYVTMQLGPGRVVIQLKGTDIATLAPRLFEQIFFSGIDDAISHLPEMYKNIVPTKLSELSANKNFGPTKSNECHSSTDAFEPPKLVHAEQPSLPGFAAGHSIQGSVWLIFTIDKAGHTNDLWLCKPLGFGLDEAAAASVAHYRFEPATCGGSAVALQVQLTINFDAMR